MRLRGIALALFLLGTLALPARANPLEDARDAEAQGDVSTAADHYAAALLEEETDRRAAAIGLARTVIAAERSDHAEAAETALRALYEAANDDLDVRRALGRLFLFRAELTTDAQLRALWLSRVNTHLGAVLAGRPHDETVAVDLARARHARGACLEAIAGLDAYLAAGAPDVARALLWKGKILYAQGRAKHRAEGGNFPLSQEVERLFTRAQGASLSSVAADPALFDGWMHVARASQVLGDRETALQGYERAYVVDPMSSLPLRGVKALFDGDAEALASVLERFKERDPEHRRIRLMEGYELVKAAEWTEVVRFFTAFLEDFGEDGDACYWLGLAYRALGAEDRAFELFERALMANGNHFQAADQLDRRLRATALTRAKSSLEDARALYADYRKLCDVAPRNPFLRNNIAFALREGWKAHQKDPSWHEILLHSARLYEEGARIIGPWREDYEERLSWGQRYAYAQMVNDTGVVFHIFEPIRDLKRAERYYVRALRYLNYGYLDAWTYLRKIYEAEERWEDLYELALKCADGLAGENGYALEPQRAAARKVADDLVAAGKVVPPPDSP